MKRSTIDDLGALSNLLVTGSVRFERGCLFSCVVKAAYTHMRDARCAKAVDDAVGDPRWATVEDFTGPAILALDPVMRKLRSAQLLSASVEQIADLCCGPQQRPIERLLIYAPRGDGDQLCPDHLQCLASCVSLPALRSLTLWPVPAETVAAPQYLPLLTGDVMQRLEHFELSLGRASLGWWISALEKLGVTVPAVGFSEVPYESVETIATYLLSRDEGSRSYRQLEIQYTPPFAGGSAADVVAKALRSVPARQLTRVRLKTSPALAKNTAAMSPILEALRRFEGCQID